MKYIIVKGKDRGSIVFIHGNSSSSSVFNEVPKSKLITQTKIVVDLPGHGESVYEYENEEDFFISSYREKLIKLINTLDGNILLVGHSLGGHIAIEIAPQIHKLKGILIFGTPPLKKPLNLEEAFLFSPELQTFFTEDVSEIAAREAVEVTLFNKQCASVIIEDFKRTNPKVRKAIAADIAENSYLNQLKIFLELPIPKYIIAGTHDPSVNLEYIKEVARKSCSCELFIFQNCGHYPSLEKPVEFNKTLEKITKDVFNT
ncbi:alpha/beta fold hydrolase [Flavivirga rizhaonensis]|uniref:Alpha/beta hydrolase n=1 Tax=Flavivirga rizhaonensis TaxID=2559571 RepID=A0A4S1DYW6_9FLAO|nr:alpha/beta hydrolase [Flavivirga rizhaonensis]TGV02752.1 alpha/beta hydrolase [Flavivirga rizhaonensis]